MFHKIILKLKVWLGCKNILYLMQSTACDCKLYINEPYEINKNIHNPFIDLLIKCDELIVNKNTDTISQQFIILLNECRKLIIKKKLLASVNINKLTFDESKILLIYSIIDCHYELYQKLKDDYMFPYSKNFAEVIISLNNYKIAQFYFTYCYKPNNIDYYRQRNIYFHNFYKYFYRTDDYNKFRLNFDEKNIKRNIILGPYIEYKSLNVNQQKYLFLSIINFVPYNNIYSDFLYKLINTGKFPLTSTVKILDKYNQLDVLHWSHKIIGHALIKRYNKRYIDIIIKLFFNCYKDFILLQDELNTDVCYYILSKCLQL